MNRTSLLMTGLLCLIIGNVMAGVAAATFKAASEKQKIQVIIDKKVINSEPKSVVKLRGSGGIHQVKIKVFNGDKEFITTKEKLSIKPGYKNEFVVILNADRSLQVKRTRDVKIYKSLYKRPDKFYNKRYLAKIHTDDKRRVRKDDFLAGRVLLGHSAMFDHKLLFINERRKELAA